MPGAVRLSVILVIALLWLVGAVFMTQLAEPTARNIVGGLTILFMGTGAVWGGGVMLARKNPFHQEVLLRGVLRALRGRTNLET